MNEADCFTIQPTAAEGMNGTGARSPGAISASAAPFTPRCAGELSPVGGASPPGAALSPTTARPAFALSPNAPEFFPRNYTQSVSQTCGADSVLADVRRAVVTLTHSPAEFYHVMGPLVRSLNTGVRDTATLRLVLEEIFQQSVHEANFRYTGARACSHLSEHLSPQGGGCAPFPALLVARCRQELNTLCGTEGGAPPPLGLVGFALFMGELLLNVKNGEAGLSSTELPQQVGQLLRTLVSHPSEQTLRCIVLLLKLTGAVLEDHMNCLDDVFVALDGYIRDPATHPTVRLMMTNAVELRASNWGRRDTEQSTSEGAGDKLTPGTQGSGLASTGETLFYNGHGQLCAYDERELCDEFDTSLGVNSSRSQGHPLTEDARVPAPSSCYLIGDQEMDSETASAFDQFVAETCHQAAAPPAPPVVSTASSASQPILYNNCWTYQP